MKLKKITKQIKLAHKSIEKRSKFFEKNDIKDL